MKFFYTSLLSLSLLLTLPTFSADTPNNSSVPKKEETASTSKKEETTFADVLRYTKKKVWNLKGVVYMGGTVVGLVVAPIPTAVIVAGAALHKACEDPTNVVEVVVALKD